MRKTRQPSDYRVEALARGLAVLDTFAADAPRLGISEIAQMTGLPTPTVFRLVATLEATGYLERLPDGSFRPSFRVLSLGQASLRGSDLVEVASGPLRTLADVTGLSVNLGVLSGSHVLYLIRQRGRELVSANLEVGSTLPAAYSSMGKVLLAHVEADDLQARLEGWSFASPPGPKSIPTLEALLVQLADVRLNGYAVQDEEVSVGLIAVAAPIRNLEHRVIAAINVATTAHGMTVEALLERFKDALLEVAADISIRLGAG